MSADSLRAATDHTVDQRAEQTESEPIAILQNLAQIFPISPQTMPCSPVLYGNLLESVSRIQGNPLTEHDMRMIRNVLNGVSTNIQTILTSPFREDVAAVLQGYADYAERYQGALRIAISLFNLPTTGATADPPLRPSIRSREAWLSAFRRARARLLDALEHELQELSGEVPDESVQRMIQSSLECLARLNTVMMQLEQDMYNPNRSMEVLY
jgi:hypothetical protein